MKLIVLKYTLIYASIFMLSSVYASRHIGQVAEYSRTINTDSKEEIEKVITSVKVMYNPVAEQISVSFKLAKQNVVTIKLMDALGNEVLSLSNSTLESGSQNLSFEIEGKVSQGFYFVRVASGTETVVKRISIR